MTIRNMAAVRLSTTDFFSSFSTALKIRTHTHTWIPAKAFCTQAKWEKFVINPARIEIMTKEGNTTPSVATMPPNQPRCF